MKLRRLLALLAAAPLAVPSAAAAQQTRTAPAVALMMGLSAGAGYTHGRSGVATANLALATRHVALNSNLAEWILLPAEGGSGGYYWDTFSNGQRRCRSASTGRFSRSSDCSGGGMPTFVYSPTVEAQFSFRSSKPFITAGVGQRFGPFGSPILTLGLGSAPLTRANAFFRAYVGTQSVSLSMGGWWRLK